MNNLLLRIELLQRAHKLLVPIKLLLFITPLLIISFSGHVSAQNTTEIAVTPAVVDIPVEPGMSFDSAIRVRNGSDQSLPISVIAQSLIVDDEPLGSINRGRYDVSSWIRFKSSSLLLEPGGSQLVEFTITVPQDASPGGHYAQINMRALQLEKELVSDNTTIIFPEVSVPVILTVPF